MIRRLLLPVALVALVALPLFLNAGVVADPAPKRRWWKKARRSTAVASAPTRIQLRDITDSAGMTEPNHTGRPGAKEGILDASGAGAAWFDYDQDGLIDLYVPDGDVFSNYDLSLEPDPQEPERQRPALHRQANPKQSYRDQLWRNNGDGTFTDVAEQAGIIEERWSYGSTIFDYDADGDPDIFVANFGLNSFWRNNGDGTFTEVGEALGIQGDDQTWTTAAAVGDLDSDGRVDMYVTAFAAPAEELNRTRIIGGQPIGVPTSRINSRICRWRGIQVYCGPTGLAERHDTIYRQKEDGTFEDVTEAWGARPRIAKYGFTPLMFDFNADGLLDVYVANDSVENIMWQQERDEDGTVRFRDKAESLGIRVSSTLSSQASMGASVCDMNQDGLLDIFITNFSHDWNNMFAARRVGGPTGPLFFKDHGLQVMGEQVYYDLSWGCGWYDFDNDTDLDLYVATGHVYKAVDLFEKTGADYYALNALFECLDSATLSFREIGTKGQRAARPGTNKAELYAGDGMAVQRCSRQAAFGDFNNDGRMDVVVMNMNDAPTVLVNESTQGPDAKWVKISLRQPGGDREALSSYVSVTAAGKTQLATNMRVRSFLGCDDTRLHFGLGKAATCSAEVIWPGPQRARTTFEGLEAGYHYVLDRETGEAIKQPLPRFEVP